MKRGKKSRAKRSSPKQSLSLPDLDQARSAVLNSLPSKESQRGYRHAIDEFIAWYCSEPRLSLNKAVVTRYRIHLESRELAPGTINGRLAASAGLRTRPLMPACSARISQPASGESKGRRTSVFVWATGSLPIRPGRSCRWPMPAPSKASEIGRCSGSSWDAGCAGKKRQNWTLRIFNVGRTTGPSLIWSARPAISGQCLFRIGLRQRLTRGLRPLA